ncbi:unnamed protein product, partial [Nesidiocoris tenuis]
MMISENQLYRIHKSIFLLERVAKRLLSIIDSTTCASAEAQVSLCIHDNLGNLKNQRGVFKAPEKTTSSASRPTSEYV